uniref:Uncharacterized protein n=1 Tax=Peronospora matthiolae TaxID=2874970 RepID=A0AAV1TV13_9STRA
MTERPQARVITSAFCSSGNEDNGVLGNAVESATRTVSGDDFRLSASPIVELDRKNLLIVKDGVLRVAESLDREQQQLDANGEVVKALGLWTKDEHERFLQAMEVYPKGPWKAIAEMVATRTVRQTQTHAQKYREKQARRVRGLRNRNGTLQTSLTTRGVDSFPHGVGSSFPAHVHTRAYSATTYYSQAMEPSVATMPLARTMSLPAMPFRSSCLPYHYSPNVSATTPVSRTETSSEFRYRTTAAPSSAYLGKETTSSQLSSSWTINRAETKQFVPDFDESMDFLMDVYSTNMLQVLPQPSSAMVTPTAGESRTPQTPMSSVGLKRHPGFGSIPRARMPVKHFTFTTDTTFVHREQGV